MGVLLFLRHGQASVGTADYDRLSDLGRHQARLAGRRLAAADLRVDRAVRGGLVRQRETLDEVLESVPSPVLPEDPRLDEYDHTGVLAAHTSELSFESATAANGREVQSALEAAISQWASESAGPYVESHADFVTRVDAVVAELTALPGCTLAVTSGGVIGVACARLLGLPVDTWPGLARIIVNASLTKVITGASGSTLVTFNDHAHLEGARSSITYR